MRLPRIATWRLPRIATCPCAMDFYDSKGETYCPPCRRRRKENAEKIGRLKRRYSTVPNGLSSAVLDLRWRQKCKVREVADILNITETHVEEIIDRLRQNAR